MGGAVNVLCVVVNYVQSRCYAKSAYEYLTMSVWATASVWMYTCNTRVSCSANRTCRSTATNNVQNNRPQIAWAGQQEGKKRVRRSVIGISVGHQVPNAGDREQRAPVMPPAADVHDVYTPDNSEPDYHDPLFSRQWHFVCHA